MIFRHRDLTVTEPDYGPLLAIAEVTRLALERDRIDIAWLWSGIAERLMQPLVLYKEATHD